MLTISIHRRTQPNGDLACGVNDRIQRRRRQVSSGSSEILRPFLYSGEVPDVCAPSALGATNLSGGG